MDLNVTNDIWFSELMQASFLFSISFLFPCLGLYPAGDLWPAQPVCLTNSLNYNLENNIPCMIQETPSVHNRQVMSHVNSMANTLFRFLWYRALHLSLLHNICKADDRSNSTNLILTISCFIILSISTSRLILLRQIHWCSYSCVDIPELLFKFN